MLIILTTDPPIKRFAQRHTYLTTDAIASRDLGFGITRRNSGASPDTSSVTVTRGDTSMSISGGPPAQDRKRAPSPDRRREESSYKRQRPLSPPPRDRERGRDGPPPPRRRYNSPGGWERDMPPPRREREREDSVEKTVALPPVLSWFIGSLPPKAAFDGPVFRTDDLMQLFRNAVIPSSIAPRNESPTPGARAGECGRVTLCVC
jgi:cleavage stimulation factor subunit 3